MHNDEVLNKIIGDKEVIRWSGAPLPYGLFDAAHINSTIVSLCWALAWGIFLIGGYYWVCVSQGQEIKKGVMAFCALIPLVVVWGPMGDKNNVKKLLYAITDKNVFVISGDNNKACSMRIADINGLRFDTAVNGSCHVRIGEPVFKASSRKLPGLAVRGEFDMKDNEKIFKGLVFYNVSAEDGKTVASLLKPSAEPER